MKSQLFNNTENTQEEHRQFTLQNPFMLLVNLNGEVYTKQGAMVAYKGNVEFEYHGGGVGRMLKKFVTGEDLNLMKCKGKGDLFVADNGSSVHIIDIEDEQLTASSTNLLAFESGISWDVNRIRAGAMGMVAGGLFNTTLTGTGSVALSSWGTPVVLQVQDSVFVDVNCVIAWSTALQVNIKSSMKAGALIGRGSGEAFQMQFSGQGFVVVQPGEGLSAVTMASSK